MVSAVERVREWFRGGASVTRHAGPNRAAALDRAERSVAASQGRERLRSQLHDAGGWIFLETARKNGFQLGLKLDFDESEGTCRVRGRVQPHPSVRAIALAWAAIGGLLALVLLIASAALILRMGHFPLGLLWFLFIGVFILIPFIQIWRGSTSGAVLARFFDEVFPGSGSAWSSTESDSDGAPRQRRERL